MIIMTINTLAIIIFIIMYDCVYVTRMVMEYHNIMGCARHVAYKQTFPCGIDKYNLRSIPHGKVCS